MIIDEYYGNQTKRRGLFLIASVSFSFSSHLSCLFVQEISFTRKDGDAYLSSVEQEYIPLLSFYSSSDTSLIVAELYKCGWKGRMSWDAMISGPRLSMQVVDETR
jgi:hypothetical protein